MTEEIGPSSPILPVPVNAPTAAQSARDWGDVREDVLELAAAYSALVDAVAGDAGGQVLCTVVEAVRRVERAEQALGLTWWAAGPRLMEYRVC